MVAYRMHGPCRVTAFRGHVRATLAPMTSLPPAGWFDDPERPEYLRYWDGTQWTEHRSLRHGPTGRPGSLPDVGAFLGSSFTLLAKCRNAIIAYLVATMLLSLVVGLFITGLWEDLVYIDGDWTGFSTGRLLASVVLAIGFGVVSLAIYMAMAHQLHETHLGRSPSLDSSLGAAVRALPRAIGWSIVIGMAFLGVLILVGVLSLLGPLGVLLVVVGVLVGAVWAGVKLAFLPIAFVMDVPGMNPPRSSAAVSNGRFWATFGRLLLLAAVVIGISIGLQIVTRPFVSTVDEDALDDLIVIEDDELVFLDVGGVLDEVGVLGPSTLVSSIPGVITGMIALSGATVLFAETHRSRTGGDATPAA